MSEKSFRLRLNGAAMILTVCLFENSPPQLLYSFSKGNRSEVIAL